MLNFNLRLEKSRVVLAAEGFRASPRRRGWSRHESKPGSGDGNLRGLACLMVPAPYMIGLAAMEPGTKTLSRILPVEETVSL